MKTSKVEGIRFEKVPKVTKVGLEARTVVELVDHALVKVNDAEGPVTTSEVDGHQHEIHVRRNPGDDVEISLMARQAFSPVREGDGTDDINMLLSSGTYSDYVEQNLVTHPAVVLLHALTTAWDPELLLKGESKWSRAE